MKRGKLFLKLFLTDKFVHICVLCARCGLQWRNKMKNEFRVVDAIDGLRVILHSEKLSCKGYITGCIEL